MDVSMKLYYTKLHGECLIAFYLQIIVYEYKPSVVRYVLKVEYSNMYRKGGSSKFTYLYVNLL
jgi:hypothetical protein